MRRTQFQRCSYPLVDSIRFFAVGNFLDENERMEVLNTLGEGRNVTTRKNNLDIVRKTAPLDGGKFSSIIAAAIERASSLGHVLTYADVVEARCAMELSESGGTSRIPESVMRSVASHEAGYAIVASHYSETWDSIAMPIYGNQNGHFDFGFDPAEFDSRFMTRNVALRRIDIALGGDAAEEVTGNPSLGCKADFKFASRLAYLLLKHDSKAGFLTSHPESDEFRDWDYLREKVDATLKTRLEIVKKIVSANEDLLSELSALLVYKKLLYRAEPEVDAILAKIKRLRFQSK